MNNIDIINIIPSYDVEQIILINNFDNDKTRNTISTNFKNYTQLKIFNFMGYNFTELPDLPNSLIKLYCSYKKIIKFPNLLLINLNLLTHFTCNNNNLTELPNLPESLTFLNCSFNKITKLPNLPNSLECLYFDNNNLIELPNLPSSLKYLDCSYNNLTQLPDLPSSLKYLDCCSNNLTELPDLPILLELQFKYFNNNYNLIYSNLEIKTVNETNSKNRIIKRMKILNRTLLLEQSARICLNPKRIERLLNTNEIDFFDGSFEEI
jgi:Leucine-rich repeat (LRR) protein